MKQNKQLGLKIFLGILILLMVNIHSHSRLIRNTAEDFYEEGSDGSSQPPSSTICTSSKIRTSIIAGAGNFLNSHSSILLLLSKIEMSDLYGVNYDDLRDTLYSAIKSMEEAKEAYITLKQRAETTPYNQEKINRLISFDYSGFQEKRGINHSIFNDVVAYLREGDVTGLFGETLSAVETILRMLYQIKGTIDNDQIPENSIIWSLNQIYSETLMSGQYSAEIFYAVTRKK